MSLFAFPAYLAFRKARVGSARAWEGVGRERKGPGKARAGKALVGNAKG